MHKLTLIGIILVVLAVVLFGIFIALSSFYLGKTTVTRSVVLGPHETANVSYSPNSITIISYSSNGTITLTHMPTNSSSVRVVESKNMVEVADLGSTSSYITFYNPNNYAVSLNYTVVSSSLTHTIEIGITFLASIASFIIGIVLIIIGVIKGRRKS